MNFKQALEHDVHSVFLNPAEFGEEICIDGVITCAVCDWSTQPEGRHVYDTANSWGVNALLATVALAEGVIHTPEPGHKIHINDQYWIVRSAQAVGGLLTLQLFRNIA